MSGRIHRIVARFQDGRVLKGMTSNFVPEQKVLHVKPFDAPPGAALTPVRLRDLKAVFFVRDFQGRPEHRKSNEFDIAKPSLGRKIAVTFKDGEVMVGTTQAYQPGKLGFFVIPADPKSNNERCYIIAASTTTVAFL